MLTTEKALMKILFQDPTLIGLDSKTKILRVTEFLEKIYKNNLLSKNDFLSTVCNLSGKYSEVDS